MFSIFTSIFSRLAASFFSSKIVFLGLFFQFIVPLLTTTIFKFLAAAGGGIVVFTFGDVAFDFLFTKLNNSLSEGLPLNSLKMVKLIGLDIGINIYISFLFTLATVKGMDKFGNYAKSSWRKPSDLQGKTGTMDL